MRRTHEVLRDRREILCAAGAAALLAAVHSALGRGADGEGTQGQASSASDASVGLGDAWKRARAFGKPLLVIVISRDRSDQFIRGELLGQLLNHGGDELLADLALCELACATPGAILDTTGVAPFEGEPLLVLVESQEEPPRAVPIAPSLPPMPSDVRQRIYQSDQATPEEEAIRKRIAVLAGAIRAAVVGDSDSLHRRARDASRYLSRSSAMAMEGILHGKGISSLVDVERGAAIVRRAAESADAFRPALIGLLAEAAAARWVSIPPPGARWAYSDGCGTQIEGMVSEVWFLCGIGHVPPLSRRFLHFYTQG